MKKIKPGAPYVLACSNMLFVDVDDTLIMWGNHPGKAKKITIQDPHIAGLKLKVTPNRTHINILKRNFSQGRTIIVWSAAGYEWACAAVVALGLEEYVTLIMGKPTIYMDDKPMEDWHPHRIYINGDVEGCLIKKS